MKAIQKKHKREKGRRREGENHALVLIMNARSQNLELTVEGHQIDEVVSCIFHTILFHRSYGKFDYRANEENKYSVGTLGYTDVDCNFIDFTYVCCSSGDLNRTVKRHVNQFSSILRHTQDSVPLSAGGATSNASSNNTPTTTGQISLEFFKKSKKAWPFSEICTPWELWNVRLDLIKLNTEQERRLSCEKIVNLLAQHIYYICDVMNRNEYVPNIPIKSELDLIFDTSYKDIQPYLFKIHFPTPTIQSASNAHDGGGGCGGAGGSRGSVGSTGSAGSGGGSGAHASSTPVSSVVSIVKKTFKDTLMFK